MDTDDYGQVIDMLELHPPTELIVQIRRLPSGEKVIVFSDCTDKPPIIYVECLAIANDWLEKRLP